MAELQLLDIIKQGAEGWNTWRQRQPDEVILDLSQADLRKADLSGMDFSGVNLSRAQCNKARLVNTVLTGADMTQIQLSRAILRGADLSVSVLRNADLSMTDLRKANLNQADLTLASLRGAKLGQARLQKALLVRTDLLGTQAYAADFSTAILSETLWADTLLTNAKGLDTCHHRGPSIVDYRTLQRSEALPLAFLRGCGLPEGLINHLPSLLNPPIDYFSCFISYSHADQAFARRLYSALQQQGIRCLAG